MAFIPKTSKATTDTLPFAFIFDGFSILTSTEVLVSASVSADTLGLSIGTPTVSAATKTVSVSIGSGTAGTTYRLTCIATTTSGYTLTGYLDLLVSDTTTDGVVVYPSQLLPFFDTRRAIELLYDETELADDADAPSADTIDANARAFALCQASWREVLMACTRGKIYSLQELTDLANDAVRGYDLIELIADCFWCKLLKRRRYVSGEPQAKDATCEEAEARLQALREGERIFDLEGVIDSSTGTPRTNLLGDATAMSVGRFGSTDLLRPDRRYWACTDDDRNDTVMGPLGTDQTGRCGC